jgi:hypothetical protein
MALPDCWVGLEPNSRRQSRRRSHAGGFWISSRQKVGVVKRAMEPLLILPRVVYVRASVPAWFNRGVVVCNWKARTYLTGGCYSWTTPI